MTDLPKGTRVKVTDSDCRWHGTEGEIEGTYSPRGTARILYRVDHCITLTPDQFTVLPTPPPTTGQLYDEMMGLVGKVCERYSVPKPATDFAEFVDGTGFVRVQWAQLDILDKFDNVKYVVDTAPQAALQQMIERLRGMLANLPN